MSSRLNKYQLILLSILYINFPSSALRWTVTAIAEEQVLPQPPKVVLPLGLDIFSDEVGVMMFTPASSIPRVLQIY